MSDIKQEEIKVNNTQEKGVEKKQKAKSDDVNWFVKVLKEEYKWETYLLGIISCFAIGIGALILTGALEFDNAAGWLAKNFKIVGWFFEIVGVVGFLLFIIPIFKPTRKELKQLTLPTRKSFLTNVARVFIFLIILASILMLFEAVLSAIFGKIAGN